jgi:outer membrane protein TolC
MSPRLRAPGALAALALACAAPSGAQPADPLADVAELTPSLLTQLVVARSSALAAAQADADGVAAGTAMAGAWMDPMLTLELAPASPFVAGVPFGAAVRASQKLPIAGRPALEAEAATHEARAMRLESGELRLRLREVALALYAELHATTRALEVNDAHARLLADLKAAAEARYAAGAAQQAEALEAELMLGELAADRVELEARHRAAVARLNGLLQRSPTLPLPPLPPTPELPAAPLPPPGVDVAQAAERRPELAALAARTEAARARLMLAERGWVPDLEVMVSYSSMWMEPAHRFMVGVGVELPLQQAGRRGRVAEAQAMAQRARHREEAARHELATELAVMRAELDEATRREVVLRERIIPTARTRLDSLRTAWVTGRAEFEAILSAERALRSAELQHHHAQADALRRRAAVDRLLGVSP